MMTEPEYKIEGNIFEFHYSFDKNIYNIIFPDDLLWTEFQSHAQ